MSKFSNFKKDPQAYLYSHSLPIQYLFWRHDWPSCDACYAITIFLLFCLSGVYNKLVSLSVAKCWYSCHLLN